jgi:hypothetical protein
MRNLSAGQHQTIPCIERQRAPANQRISRHCRRFMRAR